MAHYDDLNSKRIFTVGVISVLVTVVTALAVQVLYFSLARWHAQSKSDMGRYTRSIESIESQIQQLNRYGVDEETGNILIPIDRAIELFAGDGPVKKLDANSDEIKNEIESDPDEA